MLVNSSVGRSNPQQHHWFLYAIMIVAIFCAIVVFYEVQVLQRINVNSNNDINSRLRKSDVDIQSGSILVMIANYRDSERCGETIESIFSNAESPDLITIAVHDQIYKDELSCVDSYCLKHNNNCHRRSQIRNSTIDAQDVKGPTVARYETEKLIHPHDKFCMAIDSHLVFVSKWDKLVRTQWYATSNPNAIITIYPKSTTLMNSKAYKKKRQLMCKAAIESKEPDAMIQYGAAEWIERESKPRLQSQLAGGFNFGTCKQAMEVRNDPYTPFLFHGEEYSRAARLWTAGYDFYSPNDDICYHWYEKRKVVWERDWGKRFPIQQRSRRRVRHMLGLPNVGDNDIDLTEIEKFSLGNKRSFDQWKDFTNIDPQAPYVDGLSDQFNNCKRLALVPF